MPIPKKPSFEDCYDIIKREVEKRRYKWTLTSIPWMDYDDVSSIIVTHIYKKWHLWDSARPLVPWISTIIHNQLSNLIRNHYSSFSRPCLSCEFNTGDEGCALYETQGKDCQVYARWHRLKKREYDIKIPLPMENHEQEVHDLPHTETVKTEHMATIINDIMKKELKPLEWKIYKLVYLEDKTDEQVAEALGFKTSEENRIAGYRTIYLVKKRVLEIANRKIKSGEIDY